MSEIKLDYEQMEKSTPEQVVEFFVQNYNFKKMDLILFIKEDISWDVFPYLNKQDFKELGIKLGHWKKLEKFITDNKDKLLENQANINNNEFNINMDSDIDTIKAFFKNFLDFRSENFIFNIDGKKLFSMNEQDMKNMGLTLGQRKKLNIYLQNILKKINNNENLITEKSTAKDVATFLKNKFNMSEEVIEELALDGESLTLLKEEDIDEINEIPEEIKNKFKNFVKEIKFDKKNENKEKEIETVRENPKNPEIKNEKDKNKEESDIEELITETKLKII